jgi:hypothetical protein
MGNGGLRGGGNIALHAEELQLLRHLSGHHLSDMVR